MAPIYEELATKVKGQYNIAKVDCTVEKGKNKTFVIIVRGCPNWCKALGTRFAIRGYPTIKLYVLWYSIGRSFLRSPHLDVCEAL